MHGQTSQCNECHPGMEGSELAPPNHRYDGVQSPRCETCHVNVALGKDGIRMHEQHSGNLSCQVCHSISYTSCDGCHVAISETTGNPFYATDAHYLSFAIGKNPIRSYDRPYEYVTLRHVPVARDSYEFYGEDLLKNFDALPTWVYTTPHNIQRNTPQNESCGACHNNADLWLTVDKVAPEELEANLPVIVQEIPSLNPPEITVEDLLTDPTTEIPAGENDAGEGEEGETTESEETNDDA
jgi:thiosulfate/3-mercaptopyruvate sulfurtransferase